VTFYRFFFKICSLGNSVEISEEAEEIQELLYDIVKDYPTGVTSDKLESLYNERYNTRC
jgi:hypothetical protein